jgi:DNA-directed RNA polymerase specialized sigma24 family protein
MTFSSQPSPDNQFRADVQALMRPHNPEGLSLRLFIRQKLHQFKLNTICSEDEILHEAFLRGVKRTESGITIQRPGAWLRTTALNVIRESSRSHRRNPSIQFDGLTEHEQARIEKEHLTWVGNCTCISSEICESYLQSVMNAYQELQPLDRKIIYLKVVHGLSWREVAEKLSSEDKVPHREAALRKRGQRIFERLRKSQFQQRC